MHKKYIIILNLYRFFNFLPFEKNEKEKKEKKWFEKKEKFTF